VVVGGGIAGASISKVLAAKGVGVTLLEKAGQLCSGSTWHAAGLVTRFGGSPKLKKIHVKSLQALTELHEKFGIGLHQPGSIRIIEKGNLDRLREAKQNLAMAALYDDPQFPTEMLSAEEVGALHPLLDTSQVECGLFTPFDGDVDPTSLTNCVAKLAKEDGAKIRFNAEVSKIDRVANGQFAVQVKGDHSPIFCDAVVNAAGLWSRNVTDMAPGGLGNLHHPAFVIEHQYAITEPISAVRELSKSGHNGGRLPVLRDLKGSSYIRQEGEGFLIGPYESECIVRNDMPRGPPSDFIMELFPDEMTRIEHNLLLGMELVPCLGEVGFKTIVNGPTIWTGDSLARCGRTAIPGWYDFNSLTYGIAQSLALADYLGHIMLEGEQPSWLEASDYFDPLRYGQWANDDYANAKIKETYTYNNRVVYGNYENRSGGRDHVIPPYPLHDTLRAHGARFQSFGGSGCEVPICFVPMSGFGTSVPVSGGAGAAVEPAIGPEAVQVHDLKLFLHFPWAPFAEEEAHHILDKVGLSYSSFSKIRVSGVDAKKFIQLVTTGALPTTRKGETDMPCRLTYCTTPKGRVQTEFTICRMAEDGSDWYLVGSRDHVRQDMAWLEQCREDMKVSLQDITNDICVLHLAGPRSGELLCAIDPRAQGLPFMRARPLDDFGGDVGLHTQVFRVSFTGEMGYELHFPSKDGPKLHNLIWNHPAAAELELRHCGSAAINSLRIEKGFKFRADLDFAHFSEAGIDPFISKKRNFLGKQTEATHQIQRRSAMFQIDTSTGWEWSVLGDSPIRRSSDGTLVGYTTTSCRGASSESTVAMGYLYASADVSPSDALITDTVGERFNTRFLPNPISNVNRDTF